MADFKKTSYYFKLMGKRTYFFRVDTFDFTGCTDLKYITCLNNNSGFPMTRGIFEKLLNTWMTEHSLKYEDITEQNELEKLKLLYEA